MTGTPDGPEFELLEALVHGDVQAIADQFYDGKLELNLPIFGRIADPESARAAVGGWWHPSGAVHTLQPRFATSAGSITAVEAVLELAGSSGDVRLPVGVVSDRAPDGSLVNARVYHAQWPLTGTRDPRPSPFAIERPRPARAEDMVEGNATYFAGLAEQDLAKTMSAFAENAWIEAGTLRILGRDNLYPLYEMFIGGKIQLFVGSAFDDGHTYVLEWNNETGSASGLAVYSRDRRGLIESIRMYDDLDLSAVEGLVATEC